MSSSGRGFRYVPALDGLRALSLVAILLFHDELRWAQGGFIGVTVFFTLSGFLITSLLLSERASTGRIDLKAFWVRRARRLAPAILLLLALVAVLVGTGALARSPRVVADAAATAGWVANWRFVLSGQSYGDLFSQPTPFQHMWSLAVEEQFYLLFPGLLLLLLGRGERLRRVRAGVFVLTCVGLSTWAATALSHPGAIERSYYGTDTRMAEPFVGVLLALVLTRTGRVRDLPRVVRVLLDVAAAGAIAGLVLLAHGLNQFAATLYQGRLLLVACLAAVVLAAVTQPGSLVGRVLAVPPLVALGRISYGGYVFHWPLYLWLTPDRTGLEGARLLALRVGVTVAVAAASYVLLEQPVRRAAGFRVAFAIPAWGNATVAALAALVLVSGAVSTPPRAHAQQALSASGTPSPLAGTTAPTPGRTAKAAAGQTATGRPSPSQAARAAALARATAAGSPSSGPAGRPSTPATQQGQPAPKPIRIAIVGDSLANNLGGGMLSWAQGLQNVAVLNLAMDGCPIGRGGMRRWPDGSELPVSPSCEWWADPGSSKMQQLNAFAPTVIAVEDAFNEVLERKLDSWSNYRRAGDPTFDSWLLGEYQLALQALNPQGNRSILWMNAVCADWNKLAKFAGSQAELSSRVTSLNLDYDRLKTQTGVPIEDLDGHLCPNGQYTSTVDGVSDARPDGYHLSKPASAAVARAWLGPLCLAATKPS